MNRLFLQDGAQLRMKGYCGGVSVDAIPDTGSDLDLLSPTMAAKLRSLGHTVLDGKGHHKLVELPGGRVVQTTGIVRSVDVQFGSHREGKCFLRDFDILPGLPSDVVLSEDLLSESDAFRRYSDCLVELESGHPQDTNDLFLNIKWIEQARSFFRRSKAAVNNSLLFVGSHSANKSL